MRIVMFSCIVLLMVSCKTTTYYVVRHAEKETSNTMASDVPLSEAGRQRAIALKELLQNESIQHIYSTDFLRTRQTAQPLADAKNISIEVYDYRDASFIPMLKRLQKNTLVVGHSNTIDDVVNGLLGRKVIPGDLPETVYGDLFIVKRKGKKYSFTKSHFGTVSGVQK